MTKTFRRDGRTPCDAALAASAPSISSRKPETDSTDTPSGTPQPAVRSRMRRRISAQISIDSPTAASLDASALARMRASTPSGTLMPSQRMKPIVFGRPHGANVSTTLA
jgi:hypothetical protein